MDFSFNFYSFFLFLAAVPTAVICYVLVQKDGASKHFGFMMGASAIWAVGYGFELMSSNLESMLFWIRVEYVGISIIPAYLIQFTLAFTGREKSIHLTNQIAWFFIPIVTLIMAGTTPLHGMHYSWVGVDTSGPFPMLAFERGPWYWIHTVYFYAAMIWNLHELSRWYRKSDGVFQRQTSMIIVGALIPWFLNLMYLIGYRPFAFLDLTPFAFMATGFVIAYGLMRFRLFELVPIAREKVIERMTDGVMVLDPLDRIVDVNPAMKRILEAYSPQLIGKHPSDIVPDAGQLLDLIDQQETTRMVIALGSRSMQVQATPIYEKDDMTHRSGMLITWRDVTDQEIFEKELLNAKKKAEESDRLKTAFLANMSHEIRNPMHAILGFTEILRDPDTAETDRLKYTDIIAHSAQKLLGLLNDIIDLSKVETGQDPMNSEAGNVNELTEEIVAMMEPVSRKKGIQLHIGEVLPAADSLLETDHRKLRQILINLLSNAIKYTDKGSVTVSIHRVGQHVFFQIKDTGIGMHAKTLTVIFERFRQADEKSGKHIGGTGLGLSISKAYADIMDGLISVESSKGSGSTFTLRIPYKKAIQKREKMTSEPDKVPEPIPDLSAFSILLAEDEPVNVKFLQITLKKTNANVIVARNGLEALNIALDQNIDLILMDIMMPEMDGFEASKRIRKEKLNVPILGLSGHAMVEEGKIADAGITELLTKPIQGLDLIRKLDFYLTKKRP